MSELDALFAQYGDTMTPEQVSALLHLKTPTLYEAFRAGRLPAYKIGGNWVVVSQELKNHLIENRNGYKRRED